MIRGWDCLSRRLQFHLAASPPSTPVMTLAFSQDDGRLLSVSQNGLVKLWSIKSQKLIARAEVNPSEVGDGEPAVAVSSDLRKIVVGSKKNRVLVWEMRSQ